MNARSLPRPVRHLLVGGRNPLHSFQFQRTRLSHPVYQLEGMSRSFGGPSIRKFPLCLSDLFMASERTNEYVAIGPWVDLALPTKWFPHKG